MNRLTRGAALLAVSALAAGGSLGIAHAQTSVSEVVVTGSRIRTSPLEQLQPVVQIDRDRCIFSFVLTPPPVPLEQLEGALEAQSRTLAEELKKLKEILEHHG